MKRLIFWFARQLRYFADRIDREHAFLGTNTKFYYVLGKGLVVDKTGKKGVPIWYYAPDYDQAFNGKEYYTE